MGLFKRRPKPAPPKMPDVFVTHESSSNIYRPGRTSRFFFTSTLIDPGRWEDLGEGGHRHIGMSVLPDRDSYLALRQQLFSVINETETGVPASYYFIRCYPHYIAIDWSIDKQPEEDLALATDRIEREVSSILAEYFGWTQPVEIGPFYTFHERHEMSRRLGVSWSAGSYR